MPSTMTPLGLGIIKEDTIFPFLNSTQSGGALDRCRQIVVLGIRTKPEAPVTYRRNMGKGVSALEFKEFWKHEARQVDKLQKRVESTLQQMLKAKNEMQISPGISHT